MSKKGKSGLGTGARPSNDKYYFGTAEEQAQRPRAGIGSADPASNPPHFSQIATANTGKDLNDPKVDKKSGHFKFSGGVQAMMDPSQMGGGPPPGGGPAGGPPPGGGGPQGPDPMAMMMMAAAAKKGAGAHKGRGKGKKGKHKSKKK